jgi:hypothetical protein
VTWKCPTPKFALGILFAMTLTVEETGNVPYLFLLVAPILYIDTKATGVLFKLK